MFNETKKNFKIEVNKYARRNIIQKFENQGVGYKQLTDETFNNLVANEIQILKSDIKKLGAGICILVLFSLVTGI